MDIYVLICEAYCDDDRLLGVYASEDEARAAYREWEAWPYYPFARIERRELGAAAREFHPDIGCVSISSADFDEDE